MSRKILFFINPVSGTTSKLELEKKIAENCLKSNVSFEILFTSADGNYNFLKDKIKADDVTDVVICGGDGSIRHIISCLFNIDVNVGIIPLGSGNGLAKTAGIPSNIQAAFKIIFQEKTLACDVFSVNGNVSCHVCGLGYDALVAHEFARQKKRGLSSYTKLAIKNFFGAKTYSFKIEVDGVEFNTEAFLVCIANSNQFGNDLKIAPRASICDGLLDIVVLKKTSKPQIVFSFVKQILSGKIKKPVDKDFHKRSVLYFQTRSIKIENPDGAPFHIDGDAEQTGATFFAEIIPSAYRLIVP